MKINKISGLVKQIEKINPRLNFLTLVTLDRRFYEQRIAIYMEVEKSYIGKWVDITSKEYGFFSKKFRQVIESLIKKEIIEMPYSEVEAIHEECISNRFLKKPKI